MPSRLLKCQSEVRRHVFYRCGPAAKTPARLSLLPLSE
jgi:hypothetical protein